jgi:hypothetical protein
MRQLCAHNSLLEGKFPFNTLIKDHRWESVCLNTPGGILGKKNRNRSGEGKNLVGFSIV